MLIRFIGEYTNDRTSLEQYGVTFEGREPTEVTPDVAALFESNPEFEAVDPLDHDGDGKKGGSRHRKGAGA
jgi:hypothetical protein